MPLKVLFFILTFFLSASSVIGQVKKVTTWYDSKKQLIKEEYYVLSKNPSVLDSTYTSYYQNGNVRIKGHYQKNNASGYWQYFYEGGSLKMEGKLLESLNTGHWTFYFENGHPNMEGEMKKGKKEGEWIHYYENGSKKSKGNYKNDKKEGLWNYFYEDGTFKAQSEFKNNKGSYKEFYPGGELKSEGEISGGKSNGLWKYYYEDGRLKAEGYEENGLKDGMWKFYHPNGEIASEGVYVEGKTKGKWKYYHENGMLSAEGEESDGEKNGYWKLYYNNGAFKGEGDFSDGEGPYKEFYESGKLKIDGYVKNNQNHGAWKYYYETGELEGKCHFNLGKGYYTGYYPDQKLKMQGMIDDGNKVGIWKLYKEDGSLAGYYKTYYENDAPVFAPIEEIPKVSEKNDSLGPYNKPELKIPKKKSRYFSKRINEFQGFIISSNPLATLFGSVPLNVEYYLQERLGHEFNATYIRNPFFTKPEINQELREGYSLHLRQKFYQRDQEMGMYYFGHEIRYSNINHSLVHVDSSVSVHPEYLRVNEKLYEYSIIVGNRLMKDAHRHGYSFDVFVGIGIGYRVLDRDYPENKSNDNKFDKLKTSSLSVPVRIGVSFGYAINKKKLYKRLGIW